MDKVKSNQRRCPLLKVSTKLCKYDDKGNLVLEEQTIEFNDCYQSFCMAWDTENKNCKVYPDFDVVENEIEEDDDY